MFSLAALLYTALFLLIVFYSILVGLLLPFLNERLFVCYQQGNAITPVLMYLLGALILVAGVKWLQTVAELTLTCNSSKKLQKRMFANLFLFSDLAAHNLDEASGQISKTAERLSKCKVELYSGLATVILSSLSVSVYVIGASIPVFIMILLCSLLLLLLLKNNKEKIQDCSKDLTVLDNQLYANQWEYISNKEIAPFLNYKHLFSHYYYTNSQRKNHALKLAKTTFAFTYARILGITLLTVIIALFGSILCMWQYMKPESLFGILSTIPVVGASLFSIPALLSSFYEIRGMQEATQGIAHQSVAIRPTGEAKISYLDLVTRNISYKDILKDVSCSFHAGKVYAITGQSGSGKSTFVKLILGLIQPDCGVVFYDNIPLPSINMQDFRNSIFYCTDKPYIPSVSLQDFLLKSNSSVTKHDFEGLLEMLCIHHLNKQDALSDMGLSAGEAQKVSIAKMLLSGKKVWICDEITSHLDEDIEKKVLYIICNFVRKNNILALFISHRSILLDFADEHLQCANGVLTPKV
ncbi:MAG: ABC transporter ATP-binding protein/permease [Lachnospiraceae bacterium]